MCVMKTSMTGAARGKKEISLNPCIVLWMVHISLDLLLHVRGDIFSYFVVWLSFSQSSSGTVLETVLIASQTRGREAVSVCGT